MPGPLLDPDDPKRGRYNVVELLPLWQPCDLVPVVGFVVEVRAVPRSIGPHTFWPCAICEQFHPNEIKSCPLTLGSVPVEERVLGPYETDQGTMYFRVKVRSDDLP